MQHSEDYPLAGTVEPVDIEREKTLIAQLCRRCGDDLTEVDALLCGLCAYEDDANLSKK